MKTLAVALACVALGGCAEFAVPTYGLSQRNVQALKERRGTTINVGSFSSRDDEDSRIMCRLAGYVKTPDGEPFAEYVRNAFVAELETADLYSKTAPVTLTGRLDHVDFSSFNGEWSLGLTVMSSNGARLHVDEKYDYPQFFLADSACAQTTVAFQAVVQDLIGKVIRDPRFGALVGAQRQTPVPEAEEDPVTAR